MDEVEEAVFKYLIVNNKFSSAQNFFQESSLSKVYSDWTSAKDSYANRNSSIDSNFPPSNNSNPFPITPISSIPSLHFHNAQIHSHTTSTSNSAHIELSDIQETHQETQSPLIPTPNPELQPIVTEDPEKKQKESTRFSCTVPGCNKSFSTTAILKRHIKGHNGERPFACPSNDCNKRFARKHDLTVHMRLHTGEKPYMCSFPHCNHTFARSSDLRVHERIHTDERRYKCDCEGCTKRFLRSTDLKKHKKTHEVHDGAHPHIHGAGCGHTAIHHDGHIDFIHNQHLHHPHYEHIDDHHIAASDSNPIKCTYPSFVCSHDHQNLGHEMVPHSDHFDFLVEGRLHHVHDFHCDDHGWVDIIDWPSFDSILDEPCPEVSAEDQNPTEIVVFQPT